MDMRVILQLARVCMQHGCVVGRRWHWEGVAFEFIHPAVAPQTNPFVSSNDGSCVLRMESRFGSALLAGDIERGSERALLLRPGTRLRSELLLVPHHGSGTSSTQEFVDAVAPAYAVFQIGHRNRYGHPRADVLQRYVARGSTILRSDADGAIRVRFANAGISVERHRELARRYWQGR